MEPDLGLELETFPFLLLARHWGKVCQKKKVGTCVPRSFIQQVFPECLLHAILGTRHWELGTQLEQNMNYLPKLTTI